MIIVLIEYCYPSPLGLRFRPSDDLSDASLSGLKCLARDERMKADLVAG